MLQSRVVLFLHTTPTSVIVVVMDCGDRGDGPVCCCYYTTTITITTTTNTYRSQTPPWELHGWIPDCQMVQAAEFACIV